VSPKPPKLTGHVRLFVRYAAPLLEKTGAPRDWEVVPTIIGEKTISFLRCQSIYT
jgi:hypothetical protein